MADKISDKMTSAILAMSLSYYYVMGEQVGKEKRMDEILSTLLGWTDGKTYINTTRMNKGMQLNVNFLSSGMFTVISKPASLLHIHTSFLIPNSLYLFQSIDCIDTDDHILKITGGDQ